MSDIKRYGLIRASKKTGRIDTTMTGLGCGMLQLWALQNTTPSKRTVVFEFDTGLIRAMYEGAPGGFPKVDHKIEDRELYIGDELLEEFQEEARKQLAEE